MTNILSEEIDKLTETCQSSIEEETYPHTDGVDKSEKDSEYEDSEQPFFFSEELKASARVWLQEATAVYLDSIDDEGVNENGERRLTLVKGSYSECSREFGVAVYSAIKELAETILNN